jgi:diadenosine tetraphosphate (Ap4A) HIT family hydrolase
MKPCRFCSIVQGAETASVVLSTEGEIAFLDVSPINPGHTLVVPRRHVSAFTELTAEEVCRLAVAAQRVATVLNERLNGCVGVTLSLADGEGAGQEVPHVHFHVIPRYASDNFGWRRFGLKTDRDRLDSLAAKVRIAL